MTLDQKKALRALLNRSIASGFGCSYPLAPIAQHLGISEALYDDNTNSGVLWEFGPHGTGLIDAQGDWPHATARVDFESASRIEDWCHLQSQPVG